jgi:hypothetical protein
VNPSRNSVRPATWSGRRRATVTAAALTVATLVVAPVAAYADGSDSGASWQQSGWSGDGSRGSSDNSWSSASPSPAPYSPGSRASHQAPAAPAQQQAVAVSDASSAPPTYTCQTPDGSLPTPVLGPALTQAGSVEQTVSNTAGQPLPADPAATVAGAAGCATDSAATGSSNGSSDGGGDSTGSTTSGGSLPSAPAATAQQGRVAFTG